MLKMCSFRITAIRRCKNADVSWKEKILQMSWEKKVLSKPMQDDVPIIRVYLWSHDGPALITRKTGESTQEKSPIITTERMNLSIIVNRNTLNKSFQMSANVDTNSERLEQVKQEV